MGLSKNEANIFAQNGALTQFITVMKVGVLAQINWQQFIRFIEYTQEQQVDNWESFEGANRIVVNASASYSGKYEDNLIYKF